MLLNTLSISNTVVINALKKDKAGGLMEPDQRGKHIPGTKTPEIVSDTIQKHTSSFPTYCSHYSREQKSRNVLSTKLTTEKIYSLYLQYCL